MRARLAHVLVAVAVGLVVVPRARDAHAQTPSEIASAKAWFADGLAREEKADFAAALDLFRRAVEVKRTPQIVYHVGFCESRTGALVEALVDLESAASLGRAARLDDVVTAAEAELVEVKRRVPTLAIRVPPDVKPQRLLIDGRAVALSMLTTPIPLNPGEHTVTIELAAGSTTRKTTLAEGAAEKLDLAPDAAPAPAGPPATPTPPPPAEKPKPAGASAAGPIAIAAGGALLAGGIVLFVLARAKEATLDEACASHHACAPELETDYDTAKTFNVLGIVLGAAGLAAAALGISLVALRPSTATSTARWQGTSYVW